MISFAYFDVGGVLIDDVNGRSDKWIKMKRELGIKEKNDEEFDQFYKKYEKEVCVGRDVDTIVPLIKEKFHTNLPANYSLFQDFLSRFEKNKDVQLVVDKIEKDCKIGLLTNMYPRTLRAIMAKGIMPKTEWDVVVDSSVEGCQKPELKIFELAQERADAKGENILFIDNKAKNIDAAKKFGWQVFLYDPSNHKKSCENLLDYYNKIK